MAFRLRPLLSIAPVAMPPDEKRAIDSEAFRAVLQWWRAKTTTDAQDARNHFEAEYDRFLTMIRLDGGVHEAIQIDDQNRLIRGFRRYDAALKLATEGYPDVLDSLRVEHASGFADDDEIRTYVRAGTLSAKTPTPKERRVLIFDEITQDEERYQRESKLGEAYRCSYNLMGARLGTSYHLVAKVFSESFPDLWRAYEVGQEKRLDTNGTPRFKRDRATPSVVQAIANLFGGASTETLDSLTIAKLDDAYLRRKKDLDPEFTMDSEISKVEISYEFLRGEVAKLTPAPAAEPSPAAKPSPETKVAPETEPGPSTEPKVGVGPSVPPQTPATLQPEASSWLTAERIAELKEEIDRVAEERAAVEDYLASKDRPFTGGLVLALLDQGLIEVDEVDGRRVIRDWTLGDLRDFGGVVASLASLDPLLRDLGVTPEIARKHVQAMILEAREIESVPEKKTGRRRQPSRGGN
jgi:hypothetical protein